MPLHAMKIDPAAQVPEYAPLDAAAAAASGVPAAPAGTMWLVTENAPPCKITTKGYYAAKIAELNLPVFVTQGAKDFQVLPSEGIEAYEAALSGYDGATYVLYDDMNHLLCEMSGEMTGTSADYANLAGVSDTLAADIAQWILAR
jgi:fermentation-respiration switch protein FrsA (DUF1100 family)